MADKVRELERRWRETGSVEDEARWLQERLRLGELEPERVRLAAYLDHPAACAVVAPSAVGWPNDPEARLRAWAKGLGAWGPKVCARAAAAEGHHKLGLLLRPQLLERSLTDARSACVRLVVRRLEAVEDWVLSGDTTGLNAFNDALAPIPWPLEIELDLLSWAYEQLIDLSARVSDWAQASSDAVRHATWWSSDFPPGEVSATRAAIESELVPWALGHEDPLRSRLERIGVASPCDADWSAMRGDERVRHCEQCDQDVFDLSALTREEAERLIAQREGRTCVRFFRREDGTILTRDCPNGLSDELDPYRSPLGFELMGDMFGDI